MEIGTPFRLVRMHTKDFVKEASSLPVKHFDFSYKDNILEEILCKMVMVIRSMLLTWLVNSMNQVQP